MAQFNAVVIDKTGIHARPAQIIVSESSKFQSDAKIICNGKEGNLKSIMNVLSLQVKSGSEVTLVFTGTDADEAATSVKQAMVNAGLIAG